MLQKMFMILVQVHTAIYVGANYDDFEVVAMNCFDSQFEDRVTDVDSAIRTKHFQFKDTIDIETCDDILFSLEHEVLTNFF